MSLLLALIVGLLAGTHTATWGMFKDAPYEGFTYRKYFRSTVLSGVVGVALEWLTRLDLARASGLVVLFGLTYVVERGILELYKTFLREEDQSKYFIPMQFAVMGRVVTSRRTRWLVAAGCLAGGLLVAWGIVRLEASHPRPSLGMVLIVGSIGGWISALAGAWKDAPVEGFEPLKFVRSPLVAMGYAYAISRLTGSLLFVVLAALGYTIATIETYKTFFFPNKPRGKFAGKPIRHPDLLVWRRRFVPVYAAIWAVIIVAFALASLEGPGTSRAIAAADPGPSWTFHWREWNLAERLGFGLYLSTYLVCFVSGFVPLVNSEIYLLSVSAVSPQSAAVPIALASAAGQMTAKTILYLGGRGALGLPLDRHESKIQKARSTIAKWKGGTDLFVFVSALTGLPPIYAVSILAGVLKFSFPKFLVCGFIGRLLRFLAIVFFPQVTKRLL